MAFRDSPDQAQGAQLLQRSLACGRLAHAYLFTGHYLEELEAIARTLAMTLNCLQPQRSPGGIAVDSCDACLACRKIQNGNHADVHWVRPESKTRIITIEQMRDLMQQLHLKPTEAEYKVATIVAADRLNVHAANAFLKTLEEPPAKSVVILLTTDMERILETILSRCLRLNFGGDGSRKLAPEQRAWLVSFSEMARSGQKTLLGRYRLMDVLLQRLSEMRDAIDASLRARSPLERYDEVDKSLRDKWEDELTAAMEAEYRRQRSDLLSLLQWWLRDVWLETVRGSDKSAALLQFPEIPATKEVAMRISASEATENLQVIEQLQRWLGTNVQEALAFEVGLLKLHL